MKKVLWVRGGEKRSKKESSEDIGTKFYQLHAKPKHSRLIRYLVGMIKTFNILRKEKPDTVVVQNLSSVLAINTILCKHLFRYRLGLDTHNDGLTANSNSLVSKLITMFFRKNADFIIVHNKALKEYLGGGCETIVLPDKIRCGTDTIVNRRDIGKVKQQYVCRNPHCKCKTLIVDMDYKGPLPAVFSGVPIL